MHHPEGVLIRMIAERPTVAELDLPLQHLPVCRFCAAPLRDTFIDLGMSPHRESFLRREQLNQAESFYPLHVRVCRGCFLVQLEAYVAPDEIFTESGNFPSHSASWVEHARQYSELAIAKLRLDERSFVTELASNDGYLLQHFIAT